MKSEAELVGHRGDGEADAFAALVERHGDTVLRYAFTLTGNAHDAEDVTQDTFMAGWRRRRDIRLVDGSMLPWLLVTARNHASNLSRKRLRRGDQPLHGVEAVSVSPTPLAVLLDREQREWIEASIRDLTPELRTVVVSCLLNERPYQEVASELGLEVSAVTKRISRARARLRAERERGEEGVRT